MKKWLVFAIVVFLPSICLAQTKATKKEQQVKQEQKKVQPVPAVPVKLKQAKPPIAKFSMSMIESDRFDPEYPGMPLAGVINAIEKMSVTNQGEFESTSDFKARKAVAISRKFLGDSTVEDVFAFVHPVTSWGKSLHYKFNPDTSEVLLFVLPLFSSMNGIGAPDSQNPPRKSIGLDQLDLDASTDLKRTYQASNAYGAAVTVEETRMSMLGFAVNQIKFLNFEREKFSYPNPISAAKFNLENAKAAKELPSLKALVIMKLAEPYIAYHFSHKEPKRDSPTEISIRGKYLTGDILGVIFYSGLTGEIFARLPQSSPDKVESKVTHSGELWELYQQR